MTETGSVADRTADGQPTLNRVTGHMAEECKHPRTIFPKVLLAGLCLTGLVSVLVSISCSPSSPSPSWSRARTGWTRTTSARRPSCPSSGRRPAVSSPRRGPAGQYRIAGVLLVTGVVLRGVTVLVNRRTGPAVPPLDPGRFTEGGPVN